MRKRRFEFAQRFAVWQVYGGKCLYCGLPVRFADMTVDHVIPEHLLDKPAELSRVLIDYGLAEGFRLDDYGNWVLSHPGCNTRKGTRLFPKSTGLHYLDVARRRALDARVHEMRARSHLRADRLLAQVCVAVEAGVLTAEEVSNAVRDAVPPSPPPREVAVVFGLSVVDLEAKGLIPENAPSSYAQLCDWFQAQLLSEVPGKVVEDARDGDVLSVRVVMATEDLPSLEGFSSDWWEILEIGYYHHDDS